MTLAKEHNPEDDFILDTFLATVPKASFFLIRIVRAAALLAAAIILIRVQPYPVGPVWSLAPAIALLSFFNMTRWLSTIALGLLLLMATMPPQLASLLTRLAP